MEVSSGGFGISNFWRFENRKKSETTKVKKFIKENKVERVKGIKIEEKTNGLGSRRHFTLDKNLVEPSSKGKIIMCKEEIPNLMRFLLMRMILKIIVMKGKRIMRTKT